MHQVKDILILYMLMFFLLQFIELNSFRAVKTDGYDQYGLMPQPVITSLKISTADTLPHQQFSTTLK